MNVGHTQNRVQLNNKFQETVWVLKPHVLSPLKIHLYRAGNQMFKVSKKNKKQINPSLSNVTFLNPLKTPGNLTVF